MSIDSRIFLRRRDAARDLSVSESQIIKWERLGILVPVRIPGVRAVRLLATDVRSLAANIAFSGRLSTEPNDGTV